MKHGAILGIVGRSGAGKTTLIERLLPLLGGAGLRVSTVKHAHCSVEIDRPGKDSHRHQAAGAHETLLVGSQGSALFRRHEPHHHVLEAMLERLDAADLVLVEGYKSYAMPKIEVWDRSVGEPPLACKGLMVRAVVSDHGIPQILVPTFARDDVGTIASFIQQMTAAGDPHTPEAFQPIKIPN